MPSQRAQRPPLCAVPTVRSPAATTGDEANPGPIQPAATAETNAFAEGPSFVVACRRDVKRQLSPRGGLGCGSCGVKSTEYNVQCTLIQVRSYRNGGHERRDNVVAKRLSP